MYGALGKKSSHAPARDIKRQFRPEASWYFSQASSAKSNGIQARNKFQIKNPYCSFPVQIILADINIRQTPEAKANARMGAAVSRLNASFKTLIISSRSHV